jgi:hypothetical protein
MAPPDTAPLPERLRKEIEQAERLGRAIYQKDILAARATDALIRAGIIPSRAQPNALRIEGWVTMPDAADWVVYFGNIRAGQPRLLHSVRFVGGRIGTETIHSYEAPQAFPKPGGAMFTARQTAVTKVPRLCERRANTVVLPGSLIDQRGWLVYLLAATRQPGLIIAGGHQRIRMSAAGDSVLEIKRLSRGCLRISTRPSGGRVPIGFGMTHLLSDTPVETHVLLSLISRKCCFVGTRVGHWQVTSGRIRLVRRRGAAMSRMRRSSPREREPRCGDVGGYEAYMKRTGRVCRIN